MLQTVKTTVVSAKDRVVANKTRILATVAVVSTTIAVLQNSGIKSLNEFLVEKDLFDEYYNTETNDPENF